MKYAIAILLLFTGCDQTAGMVTGCKKRNVEGTTCVLCSGTTTTISCNWEAREDRRQEAPSE